MQLRPARAGWSKPLMLADHKMRSVSPSLRFSVVCSAGEGSETWVTEMSGDMGYSFKLRMVEPFSSRRGGKPPHDDRNTLDLNP